jgi:hypothetical protein
VPIDFGWWSLQMTKRVDDLMENFKKRSSELEAHVQANGIKPAPQS